MKINTYIPIAVIAIVLAAVWLAGSGSLSQYGTKETGNISQTVGNQIFLVVNDGTATPKVFSEGFKAKITAFDLLKMETAKFSIALKTEKYSNGVFIETIGGKTNGQGGEYWLYYVNGEFANVSADKKILKPGDKVEFKFEKSPF